MTDLSQNTHLAQKPDQPTPSSYFDQAHLDLERKRIFEHAAIYVGHEKMVPEVGDWRVQAQDHNARILVRDQSGVKLLSNVCRHRQALMLGGQAGAVSGTSHLSGNLSETGGNIVCPLHRWTYDMSGKLIGAPHFDKQPCASLRSWPLHNLHGLLFEGARDPAQDIGSLFDRSEFDFNDYVLDHVEVHQCNYNWKTFIEVYLEDYHVDSFHPGLGQFVTCTDLQWDYGPMHSVQRVGVHRGLAHPGSPAYRTWQEKLLSYRQGQVPNFGAIWITYYPTHMIEIYPHVLVLSTLYPVSAQNTINVVEFYYPEEIAAFDREFVEAQKAAYMETAIEDDEIAERMDAGRQALMRRGEIEAGPYQSPMEDGMVHFHEWYAHMMTKNARS